jgi:WD40 repeat protein
VKRLETGAGCADLQLMYEQTHTERPPLPSFPTTHTHTHKYLHTYMQTTTSKLIIQDHCGPVYCAAISHDSKSIATAAGDKIKIWRADSGKLVHTLTRPPESFLCVDFSRDGQVLASASSILRRDQAHFVHVWGLKSGGTPTLLHLMDAHTKQIVCVKVSPDCQKLVSVSIDKTVCVWNVETGMLMATCSSGQNALKLLAAWSPDSKLIAIAGGGSGVPMFEAATGRQVRVIQEPDVSWPEYRRMHVVFVTDVSLLVCADMGKDIAEYELREGGDSCVKTLVGHKNGVTGLSFSPDNKYIASGSWDNTVRVWDAKTGNVLHVFSGHSTGPNCLVWSPNGDFIVSSSPDWTACVWSVDEQVCV